MRTILLRNSFYHNWIKIEPLPLLKAKTNDLVKFYDQHRSELWFMAFIFHFRCFTPTAPPRQLTSRTSTRNTDRNISAVAAVFLWHCVENWSASGQLFYEKSKDSRQSNLTVDRFFTNSFWTNVWPHRRSSSCRKHFHLDKRYRAFSKAACRVYHDFGECLETGALYIREGKLERHNLCLTQITGLLSYVVIPRNVIL